jgi:hypothetical protein
MSKSHSEVFCAAQVAAVLAIALLAQLFVLGPPLAPAEAGTGNCVYLFTSGVTCSVCSNATCSSVTCDTNAQCPPNTQKYTQLLPSTTPNYKCQSYSNGFFYCDTQTVSQWCTQLDPCGSNCNLDSNGNYKCISSGLGSTGKCGILGDSGDTPGC